MNENNNDFYINSISYSQLRTFISNTGEWQNNRLLGIYDNTMGVAGSVGTVLHKFVEVYLQSGIIENAIEQCYKCIHDGEDGNTYIIDPEFASLPFSELKKHFKTKVVDFGKTGSNEEIFSKVKSGIEAFLSEQIDYGTLVALEKSMMYEAVDIIGGHVEVRSPIPFQAISDVICRTTSQRTILVGGELQNIPAGALYIEDTKFKAIQSDMKSEDPKYIMQAFFNYYCVKAEYGEAPKFITFREIKTAKNKDGSSQHQTVTIPFFGDFFEEYKVYFWRYITETFERIKIIQDRDFLFNIFDPYNGEKEWEKQKAYYLGVPVGQLKSKIALTQKNKVASGVQVMGDRDPFATNKKISGSKNIPEDVFSIENKIRVAFQNFGIIVKIEKKIEGYSFDQYLFTPARGVTMFKIKSLVPEIMQALESEEGIRIEAPVLGTKFIGVEIPREERRFARLEKLKKTSAPILPIGVNISGEYETIDLSSSNTPHVLVAGQTGAGKSEFLKTSIYALKDKGEIYLIDPKKVGLIKYKNDATFYETDIERIGMQLSFFLQEMYKIYDSLAEGGYESIYEANEVLRGRKKYKDTFIIIDEIASLAYDASYGADIMANIGQLVNLGRAAGFHLILATQRPDIKVISGGIKANLSTRICFALATDIDSKVVLGQPGAEKLLGKGDMIFMNNGNLKRLQGFYI